MEYKKKSTNSRNAKNLRIGAFRRIAVHQSVGKVNQFRPGLQKNSLQEDEIDTQPNSAEQKTLRLN